MLEISRSRAQPQHVDKSVITGIHDEFPPDKDDDKDAISLNKIPKNRARG